MPVAIKKCNCKSPYQDEVYGDGNRVFTVGVNQFHCTVCNRNIKGETKVKQGSAKKEK